MEHTRWASAAMTVSGPPAPRTPAMYLLQFSVSSAADAALTQVPADLIRALINQRRLFEPIPGAGEIRFVPIDFTRAEDGLAPTDPRLPKGDHAPEVGWYADLKTPELIEAFVFSRTGAFESKRSITGRFVATEHGIIGW